MNPLRNIQSLSETVFLKIFSLITEMRSMSLFEFDAEEHEKAIKQIAYEEGELDVAARGEQVGRIKMLYELGNTIPEIAVKLNISEESVKDIIKA